MEKTNVHCAIFFICKMKKQIISTIWIIHIYAHLHITNILYYGGISHAMNNISRGYL